MWAEEMQFVMFMLWKQEDQNSILENCFLIVMAWSVSVASGSGIRIMIYEKSKLVIYHLSLYHLCANNLFMYLSFIICLHVSLNIYYLLNHFIAISLSIVYLSTIIYYLSF